jgi:hypothetical protein
VVTEQDKHDAFSVYPFFFFYKKTTSKGGLLQSGGKY